jgi:hypothetical protein
VNGDRRRQWHGQAEPAREPGEYVIKELSNAELAAAPPGQFHDPRQQRSAARNGRAVRMGGKLAY